MLQIKLRARLSAGRAHARGRRDLRADAQRRPAASPHRLLGRGWRPTSVKPAETPRAAIAPTGTELRAESGSSDAARTSRRRSSAQTQRLRPAACAASAHRQARVSGTRAGGGGPATRSPCRPGPEELLRPAGRTRACLLLKYLLFCFEVDGRMI